MTKFADKVKLWIHWEFSIFHAEMNGFVIILQVKIQTSLKVAPVVRIEHDDLRPKKKYVKEAWPGRKPTPALLVWSVILVLSRQNDHRIPAAAAPSTADAKRYVYLTLSGLLVVDGLLTIFEKLVHNMTLAAESEMTSVCISYFRLVPKEHVVTNSVVCMHSAHLHNYGLLVVVGPSEFLRKRLVLGDKNLLINSIDHHRGP